MSYAKGTSVGVNKTRAEIEDMLQKHGAIRIASALEDRRAIVYFQMQDRHVKFTLTLPVQGDFVKHPKYSWQRRTDAQASALCEQARREAWRALLLTIKAKLVSVESKVETFEQAFLAHVVLPGGETVGERAAPMLADAYSTGRVRGFLESGDPA